MSNLTKLDTDMVSFVEKRNTIQKSNNLLVQSKNIKFNPVEEEMSELNTALAKAKETMNMVPQPTSSLGKWFMKKTPKLSIWFMETVQGQKFANGDSLDKIEILMAQLDQTFIKLYQNIEPTRKLQEAIILNINEFKSEKTRVSDFLYENPETPSKEFLQLHVDKLDATIQVLENTALVWLSNNIASRLKMYATASSERRQLEVTLVAGINTLKTTQELKKAAETHQGMRDLTNSIQAMAAEANTMTEILVADVTTKGIFTEATMTKIQQENERAQTLVAKTKEVNAAENEKLRLMLENYNPTTSDSLDNAGIDLLEDNIKTTKR